MGLRRAIGRKVEQKVQLGVRYKLMVTWTRSEAIEVVRNNWDLHGF